MKKIILFILVIAQTGFASIAVCFTPGKQCEAFITYQIDTAKKELLIEAYHLTNKEIIRHMTYARKRGVDISILIDKVAKREAKHLISLGFAVRIDNKPHIAHNKIMIIDRKSVITGSYNFTKNANSNAENVLLLDDENTIKEYVDNFYKRLSQTRRVT